MVLESLEVSLGDRSYPILVGRDMAVELAEVVSRETSAGRRVAVITDESVAAAQKDFLANAFGESPVLVLPSGESTKSLSSLEKCCDFLAASGLDRGGRVFAVGGGVIGDLAGFAAASWLRGIGFYQVPTTVLSMVDSSVGGKTGVNLACGKNLVGAFHQPLGVYADLDTLETLPEREFNAGMAEIIKHGMLADAGLFEDLESGERLTAVSGGLAKIILRNCAIKAGVVSADEKEQAASGGRALLNLGHTFGHAIEAVAGYGTFLHGEAVAVGLVLAAELSLHLGMVGSDVPVRTRALLEKYSLPTRLGQDLSVEALMQAMGRDKKVKRGRLRFVAMEGLGTAVTVDEVPEALVRSLWALVA